MKQLLPIIEAGPANLVLNLLNQYSHSVVEGVDAQLLKYQSQRAGLDESALAAALQGLLETGLVNLLPGPLMSLRLSPSAFARVQQVALEAMTVVNSMAVKAAEEPQDTQAMEPMVCQEALVNTMLTLQKHLVVDQHQEVMEAEVNHHQVVVAVE